MAKFKDERFITQRYNEKTDSWAFQVLVRTPGKATITKTFNERKYGSARRAYDNAVAFRNEVMFNHSQGVYLKQQNATLEDVLYESFDLFPVREQTKKKHILYFNKHIANYNCPVSKANRTMVVESLNKIIKVSSNDTIQRVLALWKRLSTTALAKEYIAIDFTAGIVPPKSQRINTKEKKKVITDRETLDKVKEAINKHFLKSEAPQVCMALEVMWYTGLRPAECFALEKNDIKNGYINVNKELGSDITDSSLEIDTDNINCIRNCKTEASVRQVPIPDKLQKLLDEYEVETDILFPNREGYYFNVNYLGARIRRLGIPFNMYQLRHTVSTNLITNNVDQRTVIEILGHEKIDMSVYYARSNDELKKNALNNI